jgi:molybdenum cofactor cytidylyltransferase
MNVAVILAAGESKRMGAPKQLLPFAGKTMLECVLDAFDTPLIDQTLLVLGHRAKQIASRISLLNVTIVTSIRYRRGMFASVQAGLRALPAGAKLVLIALCDQPRLQRATVEKLVSKFDGGILIPIFGGRQGHPLLMDAGYAREILAMDESLSLKHFLAAHPDEIARQPVDDEGVLVDIDDRAGYAREMKKAAR